MKLIETYFLLCCTVYIEVNLGLYPYSLKYTFIKLSINVLF